MWKLFSQVMAVIGAVVTVVGTGVTIYGFLYPAEMNVRLGAILERISSIPVLAEHDMFIVQGINCYQSSGCTVFGAKGTTQNHSEIRLMVCSADGARILAQNEFWMPNVGGNYQLEYPYSTEPVTIITSVATNQQFSIFERWDTTVQHGSRLAAPSIQTGHASCA